MQGGVSISHMTSGYVYLTKYFSASCGLPREINPISNLHIGRYTTFIKLKLVVKSTIFTNSEKVVVLKSTCSATVSCKKLEHSK